MAILGETVEALRARPRREQPLRSGEDYIESLRGRKLAVRYAGAPVSEPVDHPVIRPSINALARTYDRALEQPDLATANSEISGRNVNRFLHVAISANIVAVREAAVVGVPNEHRGETVKAYVSRKSGAAVTEEEPIRFCKEQPAAYEYPRSIEFLDDLPKTASGKISRRELRDLNLEP